MVFWMDSTLLVGINAEIIVIAWVILTVQAKVDFVTHWAVEKVNVNARIVKVIIETVGQRSRTLKIFAAMWLCKWILCQKKNSISFSIWDQIPIRIKVLSNFVW